MLLTLGEDHCSKIQHQIEYVQCSAPFLCIPQNHTMLALLSPSGLVLGSSICVFVWASIYLLCQGNKKTSPILLLHEGLHLEMSQGTLLPPTQKDFQMRGHEQPHQEMPPNVDISLK